MDDSGHQGLTDDSSNLVTLAEARRRRDNLPVTFHRTELDRILHIYSFMVAANEWRDYAIDHLPEKAVFSIFRRTSEVPLYRIVKEPKLARRQGAWSVTGADGVVLKRGHELERVLKVFDKPLKIVRS
ncbi:MAG: DUF2794 domain-containing protein [Notoacmeibacter sp.]|nr:DUF2794 domain-containing protein [Notoacmeibacter sp.]MCC0033315.1 DUF2794 domain-containing protein [Brucellaceae bacterium]